MLSVILFTLGSAQAAPQKLVLVAERRSVSGIEQVGVVFSGPSQKRAEASANSDFLWPGEKGRSGRFSLSGDNLGRFSRNWWLRLTHLPTDVETPVSWPRRHPEGDGTGSPHRLRVRVNGAELKPGTLLHERVLRFLSTLPQTAQWDPAGRD